MKRERFRGRTACLVLAAGLTVLPAAALAVATPVTVRVLAQDAKFIGDSMGGARVVIRNADSGEVMAAGRTSGGTGDTEAIMRRPRDRAGAWAAGSAAFAATLDIDRPTPVRIDVKGPLKYPEAARETRTTAWLLPGVPLGGEHGWVVELPGLVVAPAPVEVTAGALSVSSYVAPLCGCPIAADGLWPAANYEVTALLYEEGEPVTQTTLAHTGEVGRFTGTLAAPPAGEYMLWVQARDVRSGSAGAASQRLTLEAGELTAATGESMPTATTAPSPAASAP